MEEIGRRLKAARLAKGLTLEQVEEETRIRKKYLDALESGRTVLIPGEVYVKGFLRSYGNFLGLDGEGLVEEYKALKARPAAEDGAGNGGPAEAPAREPEAAIAASAPRASAEPRQPAFATPPRRSSRSRPKRRRNGPGPGVYFLRRLMVALILILPLAAAGWWFWGRQAAAPPPQEPGQVAQEPGTTAQQPEPEPEPEPQPEPEPEQPPASGQPVPAKPVITVGAPQGDEVDITITASEVQLEMDFTQGFPWLEVYSGGETLYWSKASGPLSFTGKDFRIRIGFVAGFQLALNGEPVDHKLEGGPYWINIKTQ